MTTAQLNERLYDYYSEKSAKETIQKAKEVAGKMKEPALKVAAAGFKPIYKGIDKGAGALAKKVVKNPMKDMVGPPTEEVYNDYIERYNKVKGLFKAATIVGVCQYLSWGLTALPFGPVWKAATICLPTGSTWNAGMLANVALDKDDQSTRIYVDKIMAIPGKLKQKAADCLKNLKAKKITPEQGASIMREIDVETRSLAKKIDKLKSAAKRRGPKLKPKTESVEIFMDMLTTYTNSLIFTEGICDDKYSHVCALIDACPYEPTDIIAIESVIDDFIGRSSFAYG